MFKRLLTRPSGSSAVAGVLARLTGAYVAFALGTTRWSLDGAEHLAPFARGEGAVIALWHERLVTSGGLLRRIRQVSPDRAVSVVVSRNRDGRFVAAALRRFGVTVLHGSSARRGRDKGGASVLRAMLARLSAGDLVAITPDGPRGPWRVAAAGVAQVAALSGCPVLPFAGAMRWRIMLSTRDRILLPLPFGRGVLACGRAIPVARDAWSEALPAIEAALTAAVERADRLCRA